MSNKFWENKKLIDMSKIEWESLCDGCGKCCLLRLDDDDEVACTNVSCILLDTKTCKCINYDDRHSIVPECIDFNATKVNSISWLPKSCSYRLIEENQPLPDWHHLVSGDKEMVHTKGHSVQGKVVPEDTVTDEELVDHIIDWA